LSGGVFFGSISHEISRFHAFYPLGELAQKLVSLVLGDICQLLREKGNELLQ